MEVPAQSRKKIVIIATSPGKSRVLLKKDKNEWNLPNSHLHWPIGRRKAEPIQVASYLLKEFTLALYGDLKTINTILTSKSIRTKLPTGGYIFLISDGPDLNQICDNANRVRKHLGIDEKIELHSITEILKSDSYGKFGSTTIEAIRSIT